MITELLRRAEISFLIRLSEKTFGLKKSALHRLSADERLALFRRITDQAIRGMDAQKAREKKRALKKRALPFGRLLGLFLLPFGDAIKGRLARLLYQGIGIDLVIEGREIFVSRCFFSDGYTAACCVVMSGLDAGILCGIFHEPSLRFHRRLTQGCGGCRAEFRKGLEK